MKFFPEIRDYYTRIRLLYERFTNFGETFTSLGYKTGFEKHKYDFEASMHNIEKYDIETDLLWWEDTKPRVYDWDTFRDEHARKEIDSIVSIADPV